MESSEPPKKSLRDEVSFLPQDAGSTANFCSHRLITVFPGYLFVFMSTGYVIFTVFMQVLGATWFPFSLVQHSAVGVILGFLFFLCGCWGLIFGLLKASVFSLNGGRFIRGFRSVPLSRIAALQLLEKGVRMQNGGKAYTACELNLVLDDASRINLLDHGNRVRMTGDALLLAKTLNCPVWTADGEIAQTPEQMADCAEKIKKSGVLYKMKKGFVRALERKPLPQLLLGIAIVAVMLFCIYVALVAPAMELIRSRSWVECPATVTRSTIEKRRETREDSHGFEHSYWAYYPDIEVKYSWEGITYRCRRYDFRPPNGVSSQEGFDALKALLEKYPLGKKTTCFVNPEFPQESVMIRQWWQPVLILAAALFGGTIIFAFCMVFITARCLIRGPTEFAASDEEKTVEKDHYHNNYADDDDWK